MSPLLPAHDLNPRYPLSAEISSPADLKRLSMNQLDQLAAEYRHYLIDVCANNGGHLAPSLGVIELTLAIHKVFDSPKDKIVWDIGHQAYPHKMITGRFEQLRKIRQEHGPSGFCRRHENEHDIMGAGHAGTSLSTAVGLSTALHQRSEPHHVVAIIGDGALTAGMAYEALHQDVSFKKNLIVILNDNEMSISPNVGTIRAFLRQKMTSPALQTIQEEVKSVIARIPRFGTDAVDVLRKIKMTIKGLMMPSIFFECFGFHYYGPINGHDLPRLIETLENVKTRNHPVMIHVLTEKGRGYAPAMNDRITFHGCGPYDKTTGQLVPSPAAAGIPFSAFFGRCLTQLATTDPSIVAISAAMPTGTGLNLFAQELPDRFFDVGICEQHAVTFAAGLAIGGLKPYVAIYSTFLQRAYDQIIHDVCIQNLNVKFCVDRAGFVGTDGATHHGIYDLSYLRAIPNITICMPKDGRDFHALLQAINQHIGPCAIRYPKANCSDLSLQEPSAPASRMDWGRGEIVYPDSTCSIERAALDSLYSFDLVFAAIGPMVDFAVQVAKSLSRRGIHAVVADARFVKPLDSDLFIRLARLSPRIITVEEHALQGGFGAAVLEFYMDQGLLQQVAVKCLGIPNRVYEHASIDSLRQKAGIDPVSIEETAVRWLTSTHWSQKQSCA